MALRAFVVVNGCEVNESDHNKINVTCHICILGGNHGTLGTHNQLINVDGLEPNNRSQLASGVETGVRAFLEQHSVPLAGGDTVLVI